jgi:hypothetical protein
MKALRYFTIIYLLHLLYPSCYAHAAVLVTGIVKDSLTSQPLSGVKVKCSSPVCSTFTDAQGNYSVTIITTANRPLLLMTKESPGKVGESRYFSVSGRTINDNANLSHGIYFIYSQGKFSKVLNVNRTSAKKEVTQTAVLAKTLASFVFIYSLNGYNTATRTVSGSATVSPLLAPQGVIVKGTFILDSLGTINVGTTITPPDTTVKVEK